jgi:hypothetical protein
VIVWQCGGWKTEEVAGPRQEPSGQAPTGATVAEGRLKLVDNGSTGSYTFDGDGWRVKELALSGAEGSNGTRPKAGPPAQGWDTLRHAPFTSRLTHTDVIIASEKTGRLRKQGRRVGPSATPTHPLFQWPSQGGPPAFLPLKCPSAVQAFSLSIRLTELSSERF